jgi:DNA repair protein RadA/Sms
VGEIALTGQVRRAPGMERRLAAARAAGCTVLFVPKGSRVPAAGIRVVPVERVGEALGWALSGGAADARRRAS